MALLFKMRTSPFCNRILMGLRKIGLDKIVFVILNNYYYHHPTDEMKKSMEFFSDNFVKIRMEAIKKIFADDLSLEIWENMIEYRCTKNYSIHPGKDKNPQYFINGIVKLSDEECFIDCGGYIGDTSQEFAAQCHGKYKNIVIFEPDGGRESEIIRNLQGENFTLIRGGVWNKNTVLGFIVDKGGTSCIIENPIDRKVDTKVSVYAIDEVEECQQASFIKMDIEGAEMNALEGAKNVILRNKPKLAICIYHSDEDMLRIIEWLHNLVPEYKIYVRHHSNSEIDTVMYAII